MGNHPPEHYETQKWENFEFYLPGPNLIYAFIYPSIHLYVHLCAHPSTHLPTHPSNQQLKKRLTQLHQREGQSCLVGARIL